MVETNAEMNEKETNFESDGHLAFWWVKPSKTSLVYHVVPIVSKLLLGQLEVEICDLQILSRIPLIARLQLGSIHFSISASTFSHPWSCPPVTFETWPIWETTKHKTLDIKCSCFPWSRWLLPSPTSHQVNRSRFISDGNHMEVS